VANLLSPRKYTCPKAQGTIYHHGAHVVDWTPDGHDPVLWMSETSPLDSGSAIRGGIPIIWPWFAAGVNGISAPFHGFARLSEWRLVRTSVTDEGITAKYLLIDACPQKYNESYRLTYEVKLSDEFEAALTVRNTGNTRFSFEEALHTYLRVGDVREVVVTGLNGSTYLDRATGHAIGPHPQKGDVTITEETDRIYHSTNDIDVHDPVGGRRITVSRTGSSDAVVWNPWAEKSQSSPDLGDDDWVGMLCVETANVGEHAVTLNPGKEHTIGFTLRLSALEPVE